MQKRHLKRDLYFEEQSYTTSRYIIPFLSSLIKIGPGTTVLEIGCGEGGNIKPFLDAGCKVTGVDILPETIQNAKTFYKNHPGKDNLNLIEGDIYIVGESIEEKFDLIFMRDVIEHIHNQEKFLAFAKKFLKKDGKFFLGFPPWQNPFGGHQQVCRNKVLSKLPYFHLLPGPVYPWVLSLFKEPKIVVSGLLEIRDTGISIERFRKILKKENYIIEKEVFFFINPNYEIKFGLMPRKQIWIISSIPWLRNFLITACYYVIRLNK